MTSVGLPARDRRRTQPDEPRAGSLELECADDDGHCACECVDWPHVGHACLRHMGDTCSEADDWADWKRRQAMAKDIVWADESEMAGGVEVGLSGRDDTVDGYGVGPVVEVEVVVGDERDHWRAEAERLARERDEAVARAESAELKYRERSAFGDNQLRRATTQALRAERAEAEAKEWRENSARLEAARARCEDDAIRESDRAEAAEAEAKRLREALEVVKRADCWPSAAVRDVVLAALKSEPLFARRIRAWYVCAGCMAA